MEVEAQTRCDFVAKEMLQSKVSVAVDVHSGFGTRDRIWFPYARTRKPFPDLVEVFALKNLLDRTYPNHVYIVEPQSKQYTTHGDLWDHLYDENRKNENAGFFLPADRIGILDLGQEEHEADFFCFGGVQPVDSASAPADPETAYFVFRIPSSRDAFVGGLKVDLPKSKWDLAAPCPGAHGIRLDQPMNLVPFYRAWFRRLQTGPIFPKICAKRDPGARVFCLVLPGNGRFHGLVAPTSLSEMVDFTRREFPQNTNARAPSREASPARTLFSRFPERDGGG